MHNTSVQSIQMKTKQTYWLSKQCTQSQSNWLRPDVVYANREKNKSFFRGLRRERHSLTYFVLVLDIFGISSCLFTLRDASLLATSTIAVLSLASFIFAVTTQTHDDICLAASSRIIRTATTTTARQCRSV